MKSLKEYYGTGSMYYNANTLYNRKGVYSDMDPKQRKALDKMAMSKFGRRFVDEVQRRLERLTVRFVLFNNFVQKEISRSNFLEAIDSYYAITLSGLVEILRIKHYPYHYNFRMRYIHYELPSEVIEKLKHLYFVNDEKDLKEKYCKASKWFQDLMLEIKQRGFE